MGAVSLDNVTEAPDVSNGVGVGGLYHNESTDVFVRHTYCIVTKDGSHYAKIYVTGARARYVNVSVAKQMIESDPNLTILDVRTQSEYDAGHIQNATLIPVTELVGRLGELDNNKGILVYCASGGRSATASQTLADNGFSQVYNMLGGITAWKNAGYWIEIVHNGNLVINGTQTFVIENCTYIETGNVEARDYSTLTIKNADLVIDQNRCPEFEIWVDTDASLLIENARITSKFWFDIGINGKANVLNLTTSYMTLAGHENSQVNITNSNIGGVSLSESSEISITDSTISAPSLAVSFVFNSPSIVNINGLQPGYYEYWNLHQNQTIHDVQFDLTLFNVTVPSWNLYIQNAETTVSDSTINSIFLFFVDIHAEVSSIFPGFYQSWKAGSISIENSTVSNWVLEIDNAVASVENSTVGVECKHASNISFINSILSLRYYFFTGNVTFSKTTCDDFDTRESSPYVQGDLKQQFKYGVAWWASSNVTRNYNIMARNSSNPVDNVELSLFNNDSVLVWTGTTDNLGQADFDLTFTDNNYTDTLRLVATREGLFASQNVTFLSETPIIMETSAALLGDINGDFTVDIYDAILLANAYNSIISSPNWNGKADLNSDNIVDIYDAIILANNYGKTA